MRLAATVHQAVTDLDPELTYDPELRPGVANLAEILGAITGRSPQAVLTGLHGSGALKAAVAETRTQMLGPVRERYAVLVADPAQLDAVLFAGARTTAAHAAPTLNATRQAFGLMGVTGSATWQARCLVAAGG